MKTSRFSEPQILAILRQAEGGVPVPELCREHWMSTAGDMTAPDPQSSNIAQITLPNGRHPDMTMPPHKQYQNDNVSFLSTFAQK